MIFSLAAALALLAACGSDESEATETLELEVAEIAPRFVFDETPLDDDGLPAYGNEFVTQGYIYPAGTLDLEAGIDGVNDDNSPEFPDKVLGIWTCAGYHVGEGALSQGEPWVVTTQIFAFDGPADQDQKGAKTIVTHGYELPDVGVDVRRAIVGGTGEYDNSRGEQVQHLIGFSELQSVVLGVELITTD
jgi:hypothetical protein